jgi:hypothetical protein
MHTFAYTAAYFIFLSNLDPRTPLEMALSEAIEKICSVTLRSKRLEGLGKSGSNIVITKPMSKTRLRRASNLPTYHTKV